MLRQPEAEGGQTLERGAGGGDEAAEWGRLMASCDPASLRSDGMSLRSSCELRVKGYGLRIDIVHEENSKFIFAKESVLHFTALKIMALGSQLPKWIQFH